MLAVDGDGKHGFRIKSVCVSALSSKGRRAGTTKGTKVHEGKPLPGAGSAGLFSGAPTGLPIRAVVGGVATDGTLRELATASVSAFFGLVVALGMLRLRMPLCFCEEAFLAQHDRAWGKGF